MITSDENFIILSEAFPDLGRRIEFLWGDSSCRMFIQNLLNDTRDGRRQGFPQSVSMAIIALSLKHDNDFPNLVPTDSNIWSVNETWSQQQEKLEWRQKLKRK